MQTLTLADEMCARWSELGAAWLREHPITTPPGFFELDPDEVGPSRRTGNAAPPDGWYLTTIDPETGDDAETVAMFPDVPEAVDFMHRIACRPEIQRVQLWQDGSCVWAARRR